MYYYVTLLGSLLVIGHKFQILIMITINPPVYLSFIDTENLT